MRNAGVRLLHYAAQTMQELDSMHCDRARMFIHPSLLLQPTAVTLCVDPCAVFISCSCIPCCLVPPAPSTPWSCFALHCALVSLSYLNTSSFLSWFPSSLYFLVPNCLLMLRFVVLYPENCTTKGASFSSEKKRIVLRLTC